MEQGKTLQEVTWEDVRLDVKKVNSKLAELIDKINPDKRYKLIKATYAFGDSVIKNGIPCIPVVKGKPPLPITDANVPQNIKNKLAYSNIPLFLTLKNSNEVFVDTGTRIIPLNLFNAGSILGLFESLDYIFKRTASTPKWSVSAGARTIFTLPKITEKTGSRRLCMQYGLSSGTQMRYLADQWEVFVAIANSPHFNQPWQNEILFFTENWLANHVNDSDWAAFHYYLFQQGWHQAQFAIGKIELSLSWEMFAEAIASRNLKPPPYLADQVKHLMSIAAGKWPGFKPADDTQQIAPTAGLQQAIIDTYFLKTYLPTIMHISLLNSNNEPIYYSLYHPTLLEGSPNKKIASTIMLDIKYIKTLIDTVKQRGINANHNIFNNVAFDYFHVDKDDHAEIQCSKTIPEKDQRFLQNQKQYIDRIFCNTSSFWRGCVRLILSPQ
jgi:hypothetical protein